MSFLTLFLLPLQTYACSCSAKGVIPISEMLDGYDHVFLAQVDDAIDYNDNRWPVGWEKELDHVTPTKLAKLTISEAFKGRFKGRVELTFRADGSNCAGGYYFQGETTLFFLNDVGEGFVRAASHCSASSQYLYDIDQIRDFFAKGTDVNLVSQKCYMDFREADILGQMTPSVFKHQNCAAFYDDYKAGKLTIPNQLK